MTARLRRLLAFLEPTLVAVGLVALVVGALDAIGAGQAAWTPLAIGFIAMGFGPACALLAAGGRAALAAWWPVGEPLDPRRAAGLLYVVLALTIGAIAQFNASYIAFSMLRARVAAAFVAAATAAVVALVFIGLAPVLIGLGARVIGRLHRALPRIVSIAVLGRGAPMTLIVIATFVGWALFRLWLSPRLEFVEFGWLPLASLAIVMLVAIHASWSHLRRVRGLRVVEGALVVLIVGSMISAIVVRHRSPKTMLEMWGESVVASEAIETLVDLGPLHDDYGTEPPVARADATRPDIVVVTIDTWRADRTPEFGAGGAKMPRFAEFARKAIRLRSALTPSNNTRRSLPAIMMGLPSAQVRGRIRGWGLVLDPRHAMLADHFRAAGYETAGFFCCKSLFSRERGTGYYRGIDKLRVNTRTHELVDEIADYLEILDRPRKSRKPVFVWIHLIEPHRWNRSRSHPKPRVARARYDRTLVALDPLLGQILAATEEGDRAEHTVVALTSDHGEGLGDHNLLEHARGLYDAIIHVPFVIRSPGLAPRVIEDDVSVSALAPTLLDLAGFEQPMQMKTESLAPLLQGVGDAPAEVYSEQIRDRSVRESQRALVRDGYKLILGPGDRRELYNRRVDPGEKTNLADKEPDRADTLAERIGQLRRLHRRPPW